MTRRFAAGVATGILIIGLAGLAGATAHTPTTAAASPSGKTTAAHSGASGGAVRGARTTARQSGTSGDLGAGVMIAKGGEFTVTAINGQTITATTNGLRIAGGPFITGGPGAIGGQGVIVGPGVIGKPLPGPISTSPVTVTITVSATTVYTRAEQAASLSDVQVGSILNVQGTRTSATTLTASAIEIVLPQRSGVVTAVNGNSLTVTGFDARTYTIVGGSSTVYHRAGQAAALTDIAVGSLISAEGTLSSDGSTLNALAVTIQLPRVIGQVSAVSGNTVTVQSPDGTTSTVRLTDTTTYSAGPQATASKSSITTGSFIMAEGTVGSDGSLTALRVDVATGMGFNGSISESISVPGGDSVTSDDLMF